MKNTKSLTLYFTMVLILFCMFILVLEPNQLVLIRQRLTGELLSILSRLEVLVEPGRNLIKIAGSILSVFLHLVPSSKTNFGLLKSDK